TEYSKKEDQGRFFLFFQQDQLVEGFLSFFPRAFKRRTNGVPPVRSVRRACLSFGLQGPEESGICCLWLMAAVYPLGTGVLCSANDSCPRILLGKYLAAG